MIYLLVFKISDACHFFINILLLSVIPVSFSMIFFVDIFYLIINYHNWNIHNCFFFLTILNDVFIFRKRKSLEQLEEFSIIYLLIQIFGNIRAKFILIRKIISIKIHHLVVIKSPSCSYNRSDKYSYLHAYF